MRAWILGSASLLACVACGQAFNAGGAGNDAAVEAAGVDSGTESGPGTDGSPGKDATANQKSPADGPVEASCGNLQTDAANCGACGHSCLGSTCAGGVCQPLTLASTQSAPTAVVAYDDLTAGSTRAIWTQSGATGNGAVSHCHFGLAACAPAALVASTHPRALVGTTSSLYWFDQTGNGSLVSSPVVCTSCTVTSVAGTAQPDLLGFIAADAQYVVWTNGLASPDGFLFAVSATGTGAITTIATAAAPTAITIDETAKTLDWVEGSVIDHCTASLSGCTPSQLISLQDSTGAHVPSALAPYGGSLYWTTPADGTLSKCTPSACATSLQVVAQGLSTPVALTVEASGIYWVERGTADSLCPSSTGRVAMCPLAGCPAGGPTVLSTGDACPVSIATSTSAVVWADEGPESGTSGAVKAVAKP